MPSKYMKSQYQVRVGLNEADEAYIASLPVDLSLATSESYRANTDTPTRGSPIRLSLRRRTDGT